MELTTFIEELVDIKLKPYQKVAIENFKEVNKHFENKSTPPPPPPPRNTLKPTVVFEGFGRPPRDFTGYEK